MKKAMVLILALSVLAVSMLTGCGDTVESGNNTAPGVENTGILPEADDLLPEAVAPDMEDGEVHDTDGIITEDDNGERNDNNTTVTNGGGKSGKNSGTNASTGTMAAGNTTAVR